MELLVFSCQTELYVCIEMEFVIFSMSNRIAMYCYNGLLYSSCHGQNCMYLSLWFVIFSCQTELYVLFMVLSNILVVKQNCMYYLWFCYISVVKQNCMYYLWFVIFSLSNRIVCYYLWFVIFRLSNRIVMYYLWFVIFSCQTELYLLFMVCYI